MKSKYAGILLVMFLLVSSHGQEVSNPADIRAIKEAIAGWDKAWNAGNCELLASLYTGDAVAMGPNVPTAIGKDALRASCKKDFDQFKEENHSFVEDIRISGSLAVARGTQEATSTPKSGGHSVHDKEKWIVVFQRQPDGVWKVLWEIYNSDLPLPGSLP